MLVHMYMCTCVCICAHMHHSMYVEVRRQLSFFWQSVFLSTTCILGMVVSNPLSGLSCCFCTTRSCSLVLETTKVERDRGRNLYPCLLCTYTDINEYIHTYEHTVNKYTRMKTHTWIHRHGSTHINIHMNTYMNTYMSTQICIHTYEFYYKLLFPNPFKR